MLTTSCAPGERELGRRRARLPDVLADRRPDEHLAEAEEQQVVARGEVAVLVEDAVVRQEPLAVDAADLAVGEHEAGVVEVAVEVGRADERDDARRLRRDLPRPSRRAARMKRRSQQQVLGRVAGDGELREEDEVGAAPRAPRSSRARMRVAVAVEVADDAVDLGECESHDRGGGPRSLVFSSGSKTLARSAARQRKQRDHAGGEAGEGERDQTAACALVAEPASTAPTANSATASHRSALRSSARG